ncbi:MAG: hypothetical protein WD847_03230 [Pirellulales bacterium]
MATTDTINADPAGMDENPYKAPQADQTSAGSYSRAVYLVRTALSMFLLALGIIAVSAVGGCVAGGVGGIIALPFIPRHVTRGCGNTITDPAMLLGMVAGTAFGLVMTVRTIGRYARRSFAADGGSSR